MWRGRQQRFRFMHSVASLITFLPHHIYTWWVFFSIIHTLWNSNEILYEPHYRWHQTLSFLWSMYVVAVRHLKNHPIDMLITYTCCWHTWEFNVCQTWLTKAHFKFFILGIVMIKQKSNSTDFKTNFITTHITCKLPGFTSFES